MGDYKPDSLFIFTESRIIDREILKPGRAMFYNHPARDILSAFVNKNINKAAEKRLVETIEMFYGGTIRSRPNARKDEVIFELPSFGEKMVDIFDYLEEVLNEYSEKLDLKELMQWYTFRTVSIEKFKSKLIPQENQCELIDIKNIESSSNPNGISLLSTSQNIDYLKDNLNIIIQQFMESDLKTLDIYSLTNQSFEDIGNMKEVSATTFVIEQDGKTMHLNTYPSTDIGMYILEVT